MYQQSANTQHIIRPITLWHNGMQYSTIAKDIPPSTMCSTLHFSMNDSISLQCWHVFQCQMYQPSPDTHYDCCHITLSLNIMQRITIRTSIPASIMCFTLHYTMIYTISLQCWHVFPCQMYQPSPDTHYD